MNTLYIVNYYRTNRIIGRINDFQKSILVDVLVHECKQVFIWSHMDRQDTRDIWKRFHFESHWLKNTQIHHFAHFMEVFIQKREASLDIHIRPATTLKKEIRVFKNRHSLSFTVDYERNLVNCHHERRSSHTECSAILNYSESMFAVTRYVENFLSSKLTICI